MDAMPSDTDTVVERDKKNHALEPYSYKIGEKRGVSIEGLELAINPLLLPHVVPGRGHAIDMCITITCTKSCVCVRVRVRVHVRGRMRPCVRACACTCVCVCIQ